MNASSGEGNVLKRAQSSIEFIALVGIALALLVVFTLISFERQQSVFEERTRASAWSLCNLAAAEINAAVMVGDGYSREFVLPSRLESGVDYTPSVSTQTRRMRLEWASPRGGQAFCEMPLLTSQVNGAPQKGENIVRNEGGVIWLE